MLAVICRLFIFINPKVIAHLCVHVLCNKAFFIIINGVRTRQKSKESIVSKEEWASLAD